MYKKKKTKVRQSLMVTHIQQHTAVWTITHRREEVERTYSSIEKSSMTRNSPRQQRHSSFPEHGDDSYKKRSNSNTQLPPQCKENVILTNDLILYKVFISNLYQICQWGQFFSFYPITSEIFYNFADSLMLLCVLKATEPLFSLVGTWHYEIVFAHLLS